MSSLNIFNTTNNINIRLVRNKYAENDDRIVIRYKGEDTYQLYFRDGNTNSTSPPTYCTVLYGDELDTYVESLFVLLVRDSDPFLAIEFQLPCFPCLRFDIQDLRQGKLRETLKRIMPILYSAAKV